MYDICAKMCAALQNDGRPFGGINIICSSDFAQLPPATKGYLLYAHNIGSVIYCTHSHKQQQASIRKAL